MSSTWSLMRIVSLAIATACALILTALYTAAIVYTGRFQTYPAFRLIVVVGALAAFAAISTHNRDCLAVNQLKVLHRLAAIDARLDALEQRLDEYGDQREIAGQRLVATVTGRTSLAAVPD